MCYDEIVLCAQKNLDTILGALVNMIGKTCLVITYIESKSSVFFLFLINFYLVNVNTSPFTLVWAYKANLHIYLIL